MITIPTLSDGTPDYVQGIALDGQLYALRLMWNTRTDHWMLLLSLPDETPVVEGRMVVNGVDLLRACVAAGRPPGQLLAVPVDSRTEHAGLNDLGTRVMLYYAEEADLG